MLCFASMVHTLGTEAEKIFNFRGAKSRAALRITFS